MQWQTTPIHFIDFEGSNRSGIVEYGIVSLLNNEIIATQTRLCAPQGKIDSQSFALHQIQECEAASHEPFSIEWNTFNQLRSSGPLAAHHASVEDGFLRTVWPYPSAALDYLNPIQHVASWSPWLDTCKLAQWAWPQLESYKLTALVTTLEIQNDLNNYAEQYCPQKRRQAHCALYDALASALIWIKITREPTCKSLSLEHLLHHSIGSIKNRNNNAQIELF